MKVRSREVLLMNLLFQSKKLIFVLIFTACGNLLLGQEQNTESGKLFIEGQVRDKQTKEPLAFVNIYNKSTKKATSSTFDGHFRIFLKHRGDTIVFSYVGYKQETLFYNQRSGFVKLLMEQSSTALNEITIVANDNYLYNLLSDCKKNQDEVKTEAKTYYLLESYVNNQQVELVECYYNGIVSGYDLEELKIKNGRIALKKMNDRFFISLESSKAISLLKLFQHNAYFPDNPFTLSKRNLKKYYELELLKTYEDEHGKTIYLIEFKPKRNTENLFSGKVWINYALHKIIKIDLEAINTKKHPFLPIKVSMDNIQKVDLNISKTFDDFNNKSVFNHIGFDYTIQYKSRDSLVYTISTNAFLQAYDFDTHFQLPRFSFSRDNWGDYRKINAIPYNEFFWEHTDEFKQIDRKNKNNNYFNVEADITSESLFKANRFFIRSLLLYAYIKWNADRIWFADFDSDSTTHNAKNQMYYSEEFKLNVKLFADMYFIQDSVQLITATILDPIGSYYNFPKDKTAISFINIYFDLMEIQRSEFEREFLNSDKSIATFNSLYITLKLYASTLHNTFAWKCAHPFQ